VVRVQMMTEKLADVVKNIQQAVAAPVLYTSQLQMPMEVAEYYPTRLPPLRTDAPTLVVGRLKQAGKELKGTVSGTVAGRDGMVTRAVNVPVTEPEADNYFLVSIVNQWKNAGQQYSPLRADRVLVLAYNDVRLAREELLASAQAALHQNQLDVAAQLYTKARRLAPHDTEAAAGLQVVAHMKAGKLRPEQLREELEKTAGRKMEVQNVGGKVRLTKVELVALAQLGEGKAQKGGGAGAPAPALDREDKLQAQRDRMIIEEQ